ncbi:MAG: septal ring lytic transglycosylase RlpA family protein [Treponema sp.]|nr:septal ring lytic transglycosylase RlpA family protein [Treponema sp.]
MRRICTFVLTLCIAAFCIPQYAIAQQGEAFRQEGIASWYGPEFDGRPTASGEIFNSTQFTAAHPTLPFGTFVLVTNKHNNRQITLRINDRGPFVASRIIDVSRAAAEHLDMIMTGTAPVIVEVLQSNRPQTPETPAFTQAPAQSPAHPPAPPPVFTQTPAHPPAPPPAFTQAPAHPPAFTQAPVQPPAPPPPAFTPPPAQPPVFAPVPVQPPAPPPVFVPPPPAPLPEPVIAAPVEPVQAPSQQPIIVNIFTTQQPPIPESFIETPQPAASLPPSLDLLPPVLQSRSGVRLIPAITPQAGKVYKLQVGSYKVARNAVDAYTRLKEAGLEPSYERHGEFFRVVVAGIRGNDVASAVDKLGVAGFKEAIIHEE